MESVSRFSPIEILQKHIDKNPKFALVISIRDDETMDFSISHPSNPLQESLASMILQAHVLKMISKKTEY